MAILGIDEVGRGPLAGPLVVGAVILPDNKPEWVDELKDSKKLTPKKREKLSGIILAEAPATGLGWVSSMELDELGMTAALALATERAVKSVQVLHVPFSQIIIDGKINFLSRTKLAKYVSTMVKADDLIKEVSAASIIAKVARDKYMTEAALKFSDYGFEKNAGYGTAVHMKAISEVGICPEHRKSFEPIKSMVGFSRVAEKKKNTSFTGAFGEEATASYLSSLGHTIIARNFKTYFYEIDIVSTCGDKIYFTEVKYRKNNSRGGGLAAIDTKKLQQMRYAAECFLKYHSREFGHFNPLLAAADVAGEDFEVKDWFAID
jgi:ribonuclease HII